MTTTLESPKEAAPGVPETDVKAVNSKAEKAQTLYKKREKIYPKRASGKFRNIKWAVLAITLGIYYVLPWIRWDRGPTLPSQAFLLDFAHQRMYLFGVEIWAQELYYVTGILIISALGLFMVSAITGRIWCGYFCPQTVWTDLMIAVEHFWQGDRNARIRLDKSKWSFEKLWKYTATHISWLLIGALTGGAAVFYFRDAPTLAHEFMTGTAPAIAYIFVGIFALSTYVLGGIAREQVCIYMCPWPRIQGAMFDADSLLITYRGYRGEPRGAHKKGQSWEGRGDCIDCKQCIAVCPMGIDIRHGPQLECIQCSLCIDACDKIMDTVGRPRKLIAYDSYRNLEAESHGERVPIKLLRPRTLLYVGMLSVVTIALGTALYFKSVLDVNVVADRNPLFVQLADGSIRNTYTVRILNKRYQNRQFSIGVEGLPSAKLVIAGQENAPHPVVTVKPDDVEPVKVFVSVPEETAATLKNGRGPLTFVVHDMDDGTEKSRTTNFQGPSN